jgi:hypothetical protein
VTQFSGPPASGKTQLALHLAATAAAPFASSLHQTWFICSSTPQVARLYELCRCKNDSAAIMQRTVFCTATNDYQVLQRLAELELHLLEQLHNDDDDGAWKPVLLVLDSCSGCLAAAAAATSGDKNNDDTLLMTVATTIQRLTRHYRLATVLINGTVANNHDAVVVVASTTTAPSRQRQLRRPTKAALGHRWNHTAADICVWLEPNTGATVGTVRATLERHAAKRCVVGDECATFSITAHGIQDAL